MKDTKPYIPCPDCGGTGRKDVGPAHWVQCATCEGRSAPTPPPLKPLPSFTVAFGFIIAAALAKFLADSIREHALEDASNIPNTGISSFVRSERILTAAVDNARLCYFAMMVLGVIGVLLLIRVIVVRAMRNT